MKPIKRIFQPITRGRMRRAMKSEKAFNIMMISIVGPENVKMVKGPDDEWSEPITYDTNTFKRIT